VKALVVGGGGREHALAWRLAMSPRVEHVYCAPGNAGTALERNISNIPFDDDDALIAFAERERIGLTLIGPEAPLADGLADRFHARGLVCLGPVAAGARLEASKEYAKQFMQRHGIPTAAYRSFTSRTEALAWLDTLSAPVVVKADGLAAGKGVVVATEIDEAREAVHSILGGRFGSAGSTVVIEEFLQGEEASFIVLTDGNTVVSMASSQDHKARDDGDRGPNTGGMGAYSPAPVISPPMHQRVMDQVIMPAIDGLRRDGVDYRGFLYAGLMIGADGVPRVLEFNCRMGDPETQPIMMRLRSDLATLCEAAATGRLEGVQAQWDERTALGVVLASQGYPGSYPKDEVITGLGSVEAGPTAAGKVFHAGTRLRGGDVLTAGGRVLCAVGLGEDIAAAREQAYDLAQRINWPSRYFRTDIGHRAIARQG
jgi:phosphoribosylamine--glycine ligase